MLAITLIVEITYLFSTRLASFRWQELYLGLFMELGKLHINVRQTTATDNGFACCQREMYDKNNLEAKYRCYM